MEELIGIAVHFRVAGSAIFPVIGIGLLGAAGVIVGIVAAFAGKRSPSFTLRASVGRSFGAPELAQLFGPPISGPIPPFTYQGYYGNVASSAGFTGTSGLSSTTVRAGASDTVHWLG